MTQATSTIAALITPLIGRTVIATDKTGVESRYTVAKLSDKIGTLKDGSKGEYVVLTKDGETGVVLNLHPNTAKKLATKGAGDQLTLVPVDGATDSIDRTALSAEPAAAEEAKGNGTEDSQGSDTPADEAPAANAAPADEPAAAKAPRVTKKSQTVAIFQSMAGKARKEIIAEMKTQLGLSDAGANTYYQNCKSGAWA